MWIIDVHNSIHNNKQKSSHICFDNPKNRKCKLGVMNYSDPKDLSEMDYRIFKLNYPHQLKKDPKFYCFQEFY